MNRCQPSSLLEPRRILVRGVNWLGDAVMTTPALQRLRERFPHAHITLLTHAKLAELWLHHPSLNAALTFGAGSGTWSVARRLATGHFEMALVLPNSPRSALEVWLARIPQRIGYAHAWRNWLLTQRVAARPGHVGMRKRSRRQIEDLISGAGSSQHPSSVAAPVLRSSTAEGGLRRVDASRITDRASSHQIHDYLYLTSVLGASTELLAPKLEIRDGEVQAAENKWLAEARKVVPPPTNDNPAIWLGLNPSAAYGPAKRWPAERYAAAAREVSRRIGGCIWLSFGGANDVALCAEIARRASVNMLNLAGKTSLRELMALLRLCEVLLTNDSGPMHLAAALGTPVVVPFGSTDPELTGPGVPGDTRHRLLRSDAPCSPCFRRTCPIDLRCMTGISIASVVEAVM